MHFYALFLVLSVYFLFLLLVFHLVVDFVAYRSIIETMAGFFLTSCREIAYTFQITDDAGHVIYIFAMAFRTFVQITFVYVPTFIANRVWNVECEVVATFVCSYFQQLAILFFA